MGNKKKYLVKSIALGSRNDPVRLLVEQFELEKGKGEFSKMVRLAVKAALSQEPKYEKWKKVILISRYRELRRKQMLVNKEVIVLTKKLLEYGIDYVSIDAEELDK